MDLYSGPSTGHNIVLHPKLELLYDFQMILPTVRFPMPIAHCNSTCIIHFFFQTACSFAIRCALWALATLHSFRLLFTNNNTIPSFPHFSFHEKRAQGKKQQQRKLIHRFIRRSRANTRAHTHFVIFHIFCTLRFSMFLRFLVAAERKSERNVPELAGMC